MTRAMKRKRGKVVIRWIRVRSVLEHSKAFSEGHCSKNSDLSIETLTSIFTFITLKEPAFMRSSITYTYIFVRSIPFIAVLFNQRLHVHLLAYVEIKGLVSVIPYMLASHWEMFAETSFTGSVNISSDSGKVFLWRVVGYAQQSNKPGSEFNP